MFIELEVKFTKNFLQIFRFSELFRENFMENLGKILVNYLEIELYIPKYW